MSIRKPPHSEPLRLQKFLSRCGAGSRRHCEELIEQGRVTVNGETIKEQGVRVDPASDEVRLDNKPLTLPRTNRMVLALNKPAGYVTTREDPREKNLVYDLLPPNLRHVVFSVGRLDKNTEGLLLFTNDGQLAFRLMHPRYGVDKTYEVVLKGTHSLETVRRLEAGVPLAEGVTTRPAKVSKYKSTGKSTVFRLTIHEGKKRQIRRMCKSLKLPLVGLKRIRMGSVELGNLPRGKWRHLGKEEVAALDSAAKAH